MAKQSADSSAPLAHDLENMKSEWPWFCVLGIALVIMGTFAIGYSCVMTEVAVVLFGMILLAAGAMQIISAFWTGQWNGVLLHVLVGILYGVIGLIILDDPLRGAATLTLLIGAMLMVSGIFRIVVAMVLRFSDWGWPLLNGVISVLLGLLILKGWPDTSLWIIGLFVGIELIFNGWAWIMTGAGLRRLATA